jgi:hypothetical protein
LAECVDKKDRWIISNDEILATFIKNADDIGLIVDLPLYTLKTPFGISFTGSDTIPVLCVLSENRWQKNDWHYKITVMPDNPVYNECVANRDFYFSDLCDFLKAGYATLVNLKEFKHEWTLKMLEKEKMAKNFSYKIKKLFNLVHEEEQEIILV